MGRKKINWLLFAMNILLILVVFFLYWCYRTPISYTEEYLGDAINIEIITITSEEDILSLINQAKPFLDVPAYSEVSKDLIEHLEIASFALQNDPLIKAMDLYAFSFF